jgi:hypothetical protein
MFLYELPSPLFELVLRVHTSSSCKTYDELLLRRTFFRRRGTTTTFLVPKNGVCEEYEECKEYIV